jgi:hypothetical protein
MSQRVSLADYIVEKRYERLEIRFGTIESVLSGALGGERYIFTTFHSE